MLPVERGDGSRPLVLRASGWFDGTVLFLLVLVSFWVLFMTLEHAGAQHLVWTGTDTTNTYDQMQYLAWIRDASKHLLVSDLFVSHPTPHDYLEPLVARAGSVVALGASPSFVLLVLQPIAVPLLFFAVRTYVRRVLGFGWRYRSALVIALFFGLPWHVLTDLWIPFLTWGYLPAVFALAGLTAPVVCYDRAARGRCRVWIPALLGLLTAWLHPWEGEELALIVIFSEAARIAWRLDGEPRRGRRRRAGRRNRFVVAGTVLAATALPLLYVLLLSRIDPTWHAADNAGQVAHSPGMLLPAFAPLLITAAVGWFRRPTTILGVATRAWVIADLAVCGLCYAGLGNNPQHALSGITIPPRGADG